MDDRLSALLALASGAQVEDLPAPPDRSRDPAPADGPLTASIAVIGESLEVDEWEAHMNGERPCNFIGKSGRKLRNHMRLAGLKPEACFISSVHPYLPPPGGIDHVPPETLKESQEKIRHTLSQLPNLGLIVAVGNVSLEAFTGFRDITRRRGSVYEWEGKKVIGMIHPAAIRREARWEKHCRLDWERVKLLTTPHTTHHHYCGCAHQITRQHTSPISHPKGEWVDYAQAYLRAAQDPSTILALDVETPKIHGKRELVCISFAYSATQSLVLPVFETSEWGPGVLGIAKRIIKDLCSSPCIKLGHNLVSFDRWWCEREGFPIHGEIRDTLTLSHCLDPASAHSLEFCASRWTWEPWWKDQDQGHDMTLIEANKKTYFDYCGLDSCVTRELHDILWPMLEQRGMVQFYKEHYQNLFDPILDLMREGVPVDHEARKALMKDCLEKARAARDKLGEVNGAPLFTLGTKRDQAIYAALARGDSDELATWEQRTSREAVQKSLETITAKTVSGPQLKKLLYDKLGLPTQLKRRSTGDYTATADATTLKKLKQEYGKDRPEVAEVIDLAMLHNTNQKMASFCYDSHFDEDGRFRFTLKVNTEAARLASSKSPNGTGSNSQNNPRDKRYRRIFLPEQGHVLLEIDASQIEGRIVFVRTKDANLIELARSRTVDQHSYTASLMTGKPIEAVGKGTDERQAAKSANHAAQRGMQGQTMADNMLKQGIVHADGTPFDEEECTAILESYYKAYPGILTWQASIRRELRANKKLTNRWGREWNIKYEEMNDDLFRRAYNFLPQSECADLTNRLGFIPLWNWLKKENMQSRIMLQEHDALVCTCHPSEVYDVASFLVNAMETPLDYDGAILSVPAEIKIGRNWGDCKEWSELPSREEMEAAARQALEVRR